jgi:hypothetical protein
MAQTDIAHLIKVEVRGNPYFQGKILIVIGRQRSCGRRRDIVTNGLKQDGHSFG